MLVGINGEEVRGVDDWWVGDRCDKPEGRKGQVEDAQRRAPVRDPPRWKGRRQGLLLQTGAPQKGRAEGCIESLVTKCLSHVCLLYRTRGKSCHSVTPAFLLPSSPHSHISSLLPPANGRVSGHYSTRQLVRSKQTCGSTWLHRPGPAWVRRIGVQQRPPRRDCSYSAPSKIMM